MIIDAVSNYRRSQANAGVGEAIPDMPVFLSAERYVNVPLENSYQATWSTCPVPMKRLLET